MKKNQFNLGEKAMELYKLKKTRITFESDS